MMAQLIYKVLLLPCKVHPDPEGSSHECRELRAEVVELFPERLE